MCRLLAIATIASLSALPACAAPTIADILAANKTASAGAAWDDKPTLQIDYDYSGQGLTGTSATLEDVQRGSFVDSYAIGPNSGASGFDGARAWEKEPSGTVTQQSGGDVLPLAINEAYRNQNLWWRPDFGGADVKAEGEKTDGGVAYDVLAFTPKGGKAFQAWFDARTHLLARTVEQQGTLSIITSFSDYATVDGAEIARKLMIEDASGEGNRQTLTLKSARFSEALPLSAYAMARENLHDYSIAGGAHETTVPFELVNNHIYADASVNGSKPLPFIFDTGGHLILTPDTAKQLNVDAQGRMTSTGDGNAVAFSGVAKVNAIKIGAAMLTNQPVHVLQFNAPGVEGIQEGGMIGYEFFARFITRFDYGKHTITFIDKKYFHPKDAGTPVPLALYHQFPEVIGSYDGVPGRFGIDTGARTALTLTSPFADKNGLRVQAKNAVVAQTGWGVGGASYGLVWHGGTLMLGEVMVQSPLTEISTDKAGAGAAEAFPNNVGGGVLKRFVVTFDYDHAILYLKPVAGPVADLDTFDRSGMWINAAPEGMKVMDLTANGPADRAGLKVGDIITAVDGKPAKNIPVYELRQMLRNQAPGTVVELAVGDAKTAHNLRLTLKDQV